MNSKMESVVGLLAAKNAKIKSIKITNKKLKTQCEEQELRIKELL
jgi:hypothetical protein